MRRPAAAVLVVLVLSVPTLPAANGQTSDQQPLVRLYGCADDLDQTSPDARAGRDGRLDCHGDRLRLPAAWLSGATDPGLRAALPTHDQRIDLTLTYHPTYWAPAPGTTDEPTSEVARPGAPDEGLFDRPDAERPGLLDLSLVSDESIRPALDDNDRPDPVDLDPQDGVADHTDRNDGRDADADHYLPAMETRYDLTWWRDAPDPVPLPPRGNLLLPGVAPVAGLDQPDAWARDAAPPRVSWHPTPFGYGDADDGIGALVTASLTLSPGEAARFFDHSVALVDVVDADGRPSAEVQVRYAGRVTPVPLGAPLLLDVVSTDQTVATTASAGSDARNVLFADTRGVGRAAPNPPDDSADDAWFVLVNKVENTTEPPRVTLQMGRMVSAAAPFNMIVVDGGMYRVTALDERAGALHQLGWSRIMPLGQDFRFRELALDIRGLHAGGPIPVLPPFDRDHARLHDLVPDVRRDTYGFLRERTDGNGVIGTGELALMPGATAPGDRARQAEPIAVEWHTRGDERHLRFTHVLDDQAAVRSLVAPFRFVTLRAPPVVTLLHSSLFDDTDVVVGATESVATPRAARSFRVDTEAPFPLYVDNGLRLYGGTRARPGAADVVHLGNAVVLDGPGRASRIDLAMRYQAYHVFESTGAGLAPISDESIDRSLDADAYDHIIDVARDEPGDNLFDVAPRNHNAARADVYAPVVELRYTGKGLATADLTTEPIPFGEDARVAIPAADRRASRPGMDTMDQNGDGSDDPVVLAAYWDRDAVGQAGSHWKTTGPWDVGRDPVLVQSAVLEVPLGSDLRFFDFGVRYARFDAPGSGMFQVTDLRGVWREPTPPAIQEVAGVPGGEGACLVVDRIGRAASEWRPCDERTPADPASPYGTRPGDDRWWVEVVDVGAAVALVRASRVVFADGTDEPMAVGGTLYRWGPWQSQGGEGVASWSLTQVVPLGPDTTSPYGLLSGTPRGQFLRVLPPFDREHVVMDRTDVINERDVYGFATGRPEVDAAARSHRVGALAVQVEERDEARVHRFVTLDPTRWFDPQRAPGHAFVGGTFADPADGLGVRGPWLTPAPARLKAGGSDAFDEALAGARDRGWDHYVRVDLPLDHGPYRVDSARLGAPSRTASPLPPDPWTAGRAAAQFLYDPRNPVDVYVRPAGAVAPPSVPPDPITPPVPPGGIDSDDGGQEADDSPGLGTMGALALVVAMAVLLRRSGSGPGPGAVGDAHVRRGRSRGGSNH